MWGGRGSSVEWEGSSVEWEGGGWIGDGSYVRMYCMSRTCPL